MAEQGQTLFYARPQTVARLLGSQPMVMLVGGFLGGWNFGDVVQLAGTLHWRRAHDGHAPCCPLHFLDLAQSLEYIDQLCCSFDVADWLFYDRYGNANKQQVRRLGLEPLHGLITAPALLHVYGGGFFNGFWGDEVLACIEDMLGVLVPRQYVLSGIQVGAEFAPLLASHCQRYQPDLIGCRDQASIDILGRHDTAAYYSGDDALESLLDAAEQAGTRRSGDPGTHPPSLGLHLNTSGYVYDVSNDQGSTQDAALDGDPLRQINHDLRLLAECAGADAELLLIDVYHNPGPHVQDTTGTMGKTSLGRLFKRYQHLDLVDMFVHGRKAEAVIRLQQCRFIITTSYHLALLAAVAAVPVYLYAFNSFYRQKRDGIGQPDLSLPAFLEADRGMLVAHEQRTVAQQAAGRSLWMQQMALTPLTLPERLSVRGRVGAAAPCRALAIRCCRQATTPRQDWSAPGHHLGAHAQRATGPADQSKQTSRAAPAKIVGAQSHEIDDDYPPLCGGGRDMLLTRSALEEWEVETCC